MKKLKYYGRLQLYKTSKNKQQKKRKAFKRNYGTALTYNNTSYIPYIPYNNTSYLWHTS